MSYDFIKMHGLGNDFVIIDQREDEMDLDIKKIQAITNRRTGIGCDQLILIDSPIDSGADILMKIYNQDGKEAGACGNALRCLGHLLAEEFKRSNCVIQTIEGILQTNVNDDGSVTVDMGKPKLEWQEIPLAKKCNTLKLPIKLGVLKEPTAVSMGNPHMVFFVEDLKGIDHHNLGQQLTSHELYPQQANVEFVEIINRNSIKVKVYERGVGITMSCGTGAAASVVAAYKRKLIDNNVKVILDGGNLDISYNNDQVIINGLVGYSFKGSFGEEIFNNA